MSRKYKKKSKGCFDDTYELIKLIRSEGESKKVLPPSERDYRIERSAEDPQFFFKTYLSHWFVSEPAPFHYQIPDLFKIKNRPIIIVAPRGGAKSTFLRAETIRLILTGKQPFMVRVEENERMASKVIFNIRREVEDNPLIRADFGNVQGQPWQASELMFRNGCLLWGRGRRQPIRGTISGHNRPTGIIYNDIESPDQVNNKEQTEMIYDALFKVALPALAPPIAGGGFLAVVGTILGKESMLAKLIDNEVSTTIKYPALTPRKSGDDGVISLLLGKVSRDVGRIMDHIDSIPPSEDEYDPVYMERRASFFRKRSNYVNLISKLESYWPARFPIEELLIYAATMGTVAFLQEYQHIPTDSLDGVFKREWFERAYYKPEDIGNAGLIRATFLDPSYKDHTGADYKAFVTGIYDPSCNTGYVVHALVRNGTLDEMIQWAFEISGDFLTGNVRVGNRTIPESAFRDSIFAYESNGAQEWLEPMFEENSKRFGFRLPKITGVLHKGNKNARILKLSYPVERGQLRMDPGSSDQAIVIDECCFLTNKGYHDDGADAMEGWWSVVEKSRITLSISSRDSMPMRRIGDRGRVADNGYNYGKGIDETIEGALRKQIASGKKRRYRSITGISKPAAGLRYFGR
ncbi:MAG: hypothetical protein GY861_22610 [bacterium]|nr:hypothetical protein [bacterium]